MFSMQLLDKSYFLKQTGSGIYPPTSKSLLARRFFVFFLNLNKLFLS